MQQPCEDEKGKLVVNDTSYRRTPCTVGYNGDISECVTQDDYETVKQDDYEETEQEIGEVRISRKRPKNKSLKGESKKKINAAPYSIIAHKKAKSESVEQNEKFYKDESYKHFVDTSNRNVAETLGIQLRDQYAEDFDNEDHCINLKKSKAKQSSTYKKGCIIYESEQALNQLLRDLKSSDLDKCGVIRASSKDTIKLADDKTYVLGKNYTEDGVLGKGASGLVKLMTDKISGKKFVSKQLDIKNFDPKEVEVMTQLSHENITQFHGLLVDKNIIQLLQSFSGKSLGDLAKVTSFSEDGVINISIQACSALKYMHSYGIIHMDIKPDNVCVKPETGELFLTDFGSCKTPQQAIDGKGLTPEYMSPELNKVIINRQSQSKIFEEEEITGKNDIYGWGLTMCFMIERAHSMLKYMNLKPNITAQEFSNARAIYRCQIAQNPHFMSTVVPDDIPRDIREVIQKCLHGDVQERFTAAETIQQLLCIQQSRILPVVQQNRLVKHQNIKDKLNNKLKMKNGPFPEEIISEPESLVETSPLSPPPITTTTATNDNCPNFLALFSD
ncbi:uncharacterized protein LOC126809535 [Patella vulgata]|uniref:uncharacterized protein LOC126809535 n=1 Tax=Patella vulgata TaxID=6465 RepID=UPI00218036EC|nr:uncharacterized protein LOC126809535 [Patella vulgata]